jgi:hypothetical protein
MELLKAASINLFDVCGSNLESLSTDLLVNPVFQCDVSKI